MDAAPPRADHDEPGAGSPLARARIRGTLTLEQAAEAAGITPDEARWLEEGRLYRFADTAAAIAATIAYAGAVGALTEHAREVVARAAVRARSPRRRRLVAGIVALLAAGVAAAVVAALAESGGHASGAGAGSGAGQLAAPLAPAAPAPASLRVDVVAWTGSAAAERLVRRLRALGYPSGHVTAGQGRPAGQEDAGSGVYFEPGGDAAAAALAARLALPARPLPAGSDPSRLVVVLDPAG